MLRVAGGTAKITDLGAGDACTEREAGQIAGQTYTDTVLQRQQHIVAVTGAIIAHVVAIEVIAQTIDKTLIRNHRTAAVKGAAAANPIPQPIVKGPYPGTGHIQL